MGKPTTNFSRMGNVSFIDNKCCFISLATRILGCLLLWPATGETRELDCWTRKWSLVPLGDEIQQPCTPWTGELCVCRTNPICLKGLEGLECLRAGTKLAIKIKGQFITTLRCDGLYNRRWMAEPSRKRGEPFDTCQLQKLTRRLKEAAISRILSQTTRQSTRGSPSPPSIAYRHLVIRFSSKPRSANTTREISHNNEATTVDTMVISTKNTQHNRIKRTTETNVSETTIPPLSCQTGRWSAAIRNLPRQHCKSIYKTVCTYDSDFHIQRIQGGPCLLEDIAVGKQVGPEIISFFECKRVDGRLIWVADRLTNRWERYQACLENEESATTMAVSAAIVADSHMPTDMQTGNNHGGGTTTTERIRTAAQIMTVYPASAWTTASDAVSEPAITTNRTDHEPSKETTRHRRNAKERFTTVTTQSTTSIGQDVLQELASVSSDNTDTIKISQTQENNTSYLAGLGEARFVPINALQFSTEHWEPIVGSKWQTMNVADAFSGEITKERAYTNPQLFYNSLFGYAIADGNTFTQKFLTGGKFWDDARLFERTCLCKRIVREITPKLTYANLNKMVTYTRATGQVRHYWQWNDTLSNYMKLNPDNAWTIVMTAYKTRIMKFFVRYSQVTANCSQRWVYDPNNEYRDWAANNTRASTANQIIRIATGVEPCGTKVWVTLCDFTPSLPVVDVARADVLIQEVDRLLTHDDPRRPRYPSLRNNRLELGRIRIKHLHQFNKHTPMWFCAELYSRGGDSRTLLPPSAVIWQPSENKYLDKRLVWLAPVKQKTNLLDGPVQASELNGNHPRWPHKTRWPSQVAEHRSCIQRTGLEGKPCTHAAGSLHLKIAYWDDIKFDSTNNKSMYPSQEITLKGYGNIKMGSYDKRKLLNYMRSHEKVRKRRQALGGLAMVFALENTKHVQLVNQKINSLQDQLNLKMRQMTNEIDQRNAETTERLRKLAEATNQIDTKLEITDERLAEIINTLLHREELQEQSNKFMMEKMNANSRMILLNANELLNLNIKVSEMDETELYTGLSIIAHMKNSTTNKLFKRDSAYEVQFGQGLIYFREHQRRIRRNIEHFVNEQKDLDEEISGNFQDMERLDNITSYEVNKLLTNGSQIKVRLNATLWKYENITKQNFTTNNTLSTTELSGPIGNVVRGLAKVLGAAGEGTEKAIKGIGESVGGFLGNLFGKTAAGILKPLLPVIAIVAVAIVLWLLIQLHPRCHRARRALPTMLVARRSLERDAIRRQRRKRARQRDETEAMLA